MPATPNSECRIPDLPDFLLSNQNPDGGWGFHPASPSALEATAWGLRALLASPQAAASANACARARDLLVQTQLADGSWPAFPGQSPGCWVTSLAAQALHQQGGAQAAVERGLHWLLNSWPAEGGWWWRLRQAVLPSRVSRQNNSLRGWNWTPGTASWVEPTAYALLLLRSLPPQMLPSLAAKRRDLAERMLFDRMCPGGGWNSGNPLIYGVAGVPRVGPTAWALLALRDQGRRGEIQASLQWLAEVYGTICAPASLALAHRALRAHGRAVPPLAPPLEAMCSRTRFFPSTVTTAWVILALNEEGKAEVHTAAKPQGL